MLKAIIAGLLKESETRHKTRNHLRAYLILLEVGRMHGSHGGHMVLTCSLPVLRTPSSGSQTHMSSSPTSSGSSPSWPTSTIDTWSTGSEGAAGRLLHWGQW